ncbi:hypothetical protein LPJ61_001001 [Coemansia biformis]|uniref:Rab-GAP TBC domain-containing protein n=1 Tax=Coemansia biformis TaxID=1286918 RepID=A0A9W7YHM2_9FUNG|nr:hypothetical protein LPJ61_001001 [Coemansia biformis]
MAMSRTAAAAAAAAGWSHMDVAPKDCDEAVAAGDAALAGSPARPHDAAPAEQHGPDDLRLMAEHAARHAHHTPAQLPKAGGDVRHEAAAADQPPRSLTASSLTVGPADGAASMASSAAAPPSLPSSPSSSSGSLGRPWPGTATSSSAAGITTANAGHCAVECQRMATVPADVTGADSTQSDNNIVNNSGSYGAGADSESGSGGSSRTGEDACHRAGSKSGSAAAARALPPPAMLPLHVGAPAPAPPRHQRRQSPDGGGSARVGKTPGAADAEYVDRFGSYYDYLPIVDKGSPQGHAAGPGAAAPQLRSTHKSAPAINTLARAADGSGALPVDQDPCSSYSQMLENVLIYSQAIDQIRESDAVDTSALDAAAAAAPRPRPGKEGIRQRRARNTIASRDALQFTAPSTFIPLPGGWAALPPAPAPAPALSLERSLAMRSEPEFRLYTSEGRLGAKAAGRKRDPQPGRSGSSMNGSASASRSAVPISRFLPRSTGGRPRNASMSRAATAPLPAADAGASLGGGGGGDGADFESERRAGLDQPVSTFGVLDGGLKQRGGASPQTPSSSLRAPHSMYTRPRPYSMADSDSVATGDQASYAPAARQQSRLSVASRVSSFAESVRIPAASIIKSVPRRHLQQISQHSRKVATRLLMRAGLSRIAIRVATTGSVSKGSGGGGGTGGNGIGGSSSSCVFESGDAMASSVADGDAAGGIELDPNGLQGLKAERRKQVKFVDEFGFMHFEDSDARGSEQIQQYEAWCARSASAAKAPRPRLDVRSGSEAKWDALLASFDSTALRASRKVKRLVQAGVAPAARARFYYVLSGAPALEQPGEYARLAGQPSLPIYDVIERDVARCYPDHVLFADAGGMGQRQLRRILRAYAQFNQDIGYCQGMGRLVGLFLIAGLGEEQAFWVLAATIRNAIPRYYEPDLGGLREHTAVFEVLMHERNPRLAGHLAEQGCDALMYATPWFMTVFTLSLPWPAALRVWDWFMFRGPKVLFRVALGIADLASAYLLEACPTIAEQLGFLLHIPPGLVDADAVIAAAARVRVSERHIGQLIQRAGADTRRRKP